MGEEMTYIYQDEEFILEHISQLVVQVTHGDDRGYFGLSADRDPTYPYTWTPHDVGHPSRRHSPREHLFPLHTEGRRGRTVPRDAE